jgi:hypothetical protein
MISVSSSALPVAQAPCHGAVERHAHILYSTVWSV